MARRISSRPNVDVFDRDALGHGGYLYTIGNRFSSHLATKRTTDAILETGRFAGRHVLDMACGDGFYTIKYWDRGSPRAMIGADAAYHAVQVASINKQSRPIHFLVGDVHHLPHRDNSFDLVLLQSILHHDNNPFDIIREAVRLAPEILIHEPNGYNLGLKIIEKTSHYHREHNEKSYTALRLRRWVEEAGGTVVYQRYAGFVPMFCPDWLARGMKAVEQLVEALPLVNAMGSAVYILTAVRAH